MWEQKRKEIIAETIKISYRYNVMRYPINPETWEGQPLGAWPATDNERKNEIVPSHRPVLFVLYPSRPWANPASPISSPRVFQLLQDDEVGIHPSIDAVLRASLLWTIQWSRWDLSRSALLPADLCELVYGCWAGRNVSYDPISIQHWVTDDILCWMFAFWASVFRNWVTSFLSAALSFDGSSPAAAASMIADSEMERGFLEVVEIEM